MDSKKIIERQRNRTRKSTILGLAVATGILGATTLGLGISYGVTNTKMDAVSNQLEAVYKKNYYELVDSANSCDTDISKLLASSDNDFRAKMLNQISQSAKDMQSSIAELPLNSDGILQSVKFINQMSGYTEILEEKIGQGETLTEEDLAVLQEMHQTLNEMKNFLNEMSQRMIAGYSIMYAGGMMHGDYDEFSWNFTQISPTEYPTMIYDGPFSDSVENKEIVGLSGKEVSKEDVYKKIDSLFGNISSIKYLGETKGKFETYNFKTINADDQILYVQATKIGGNILTVSGNTQSGQNLIDYEEAEKIALNFVKKNGIEDAQVVWNQELNSQMYFNIAPILDEVVLYPDLVKVKVDLQNGNVIGYDAISYLTNHKERELEKPTISIDSARALIDDSFVVENERLVLSPLDYNREVLCYEFKCSRDNAIFYFYIGATSGIQENLLKVVETSDGNKLM